MADDKKEGKSKNAPGTKGGAPKGGAKGGAKGGGEPKQKGEGKGGKRASMLPTEHAGTNIPAPKPRLRLVTRSRKIVLRTAVAKRSTARRGAKAAPPMKQAKVISVTTTRALPKPKPAVSEMTVKEREALSDARGI